MGVEIVAPIAGVAAVPMASKVDAYCIATGLRQRSRRSMPDGAGLPRRRDEQDGWVFGNSEAVAYQANIIQAGKFQSLHPDPLIPCTS